jgi:hypothetical protein
VFFFPDPPAQKVSPFSYLNPHPVLYLFPPSALIWKRAKALYPNKRK